MVLVYKWKVCAVFFSLIDSLERSLVRVFVLFVQLLFYILYHSFGLRCPLTFLVVALTGFFFYVCVCSLIAGTESRVDRGEFTTLHSSSKFRDPLSLSLSLSLVCGLSFWEKRPSTEWWTKTWLLSGLFTNFFFSSRIRPKVILYIILFLFHLCSLSLFVDLYPVGTTLPDISTIH